MSPDRGVARHLTSVPPPAADPDAAWEAAWADALTAMELEVAAAEECLAADHLPPVDPAASWAPPSLPGSLPAALKDRAEALLTRQLAVARQLGEMAEKSRRHLAVVRDLQATAPAVPVYLDILG